MHTAQRQLFYYCGVVVSYVYCIFNVIINVFVGVSGRYLAR